MKNLFAIDFANNTIVASKTTLKKASMSDLKGREKNYVRTASLHLQGDVRPVWDKG